MLNVCKPKLFLLTALPGMLWQNIFINLVSLHPPICLIFFDLQFDYLQEEDRANGNAMTSDRFKESVYHFWLSKSADGPGKYICGPFDSVDTGELEKKIRHQS